MTSPVTQREYVLDPNVTIVSRTDLMGNIQHANPAFIEASGFTWQELEGKAHNILRHPDVPKAVFKDFWETLQKGLPWTQIVKNKRKNGDHYWVEANATPVFENGQIVGYVSVRKAATREQIQAAEQLYQQVNAGKISIRGGKVITLKDRVLAPLQKLSIGWQALLAIFAINLIPLTTLLFGIEISLAEEIGVIALSSIVIFMLMSHHSRNFKKLSIDLLAISEGDFSREIDFAHVGNKNTLPERHKLAAHLKSMQIKLGNDLDDSNRKLDESTRVQIALDTATTNMMVADDQNNIVFMNEALHKMLKGNEAKLKEALPHFDADNIIGQNVDIFHANPAHQQRMIAMLNSTVDTNIEVAGLTMNLIMSPVSSEDGRRLGTVVEWRDVTQQLSIENRIKNLIERASIGHLSQRLETDGMDGFYLQLSQNINGLMSSIQNVMERISNVVISMSEGHLDKRINERYEGELDTLKHALNNSTSRIERTIASMMVSSESVNTAATEVAQGSEYLSERTQQQAAAIEETAAAMEQITSTVQGNSDLANKALTITVDASKQSHRGSEIVQQAAVAMNAITESSNKINDIISVIESIAFQTNLLALNAAVEAARAGEHGRGFAVVAGEVRALAQKSADASKEISHLIMNSTNSVQEGARYVEDTVSALDEIQASVNDVTQIINEISGSLNEQAQSVQEINRAVNDMDATTQQNAALVEETSSAAGNMHNQAEDMLRTASFFKVKVDQLSDQAAFTSELGQGLAISDHEMNRARDLNGNQLQIEVDRMHFEHKNFVLKLRSIVRGEDSQHMINQDPNTCNLGIWLQKQKMHNSYGISERNLQLVEAKHLELHKSATHCIHALNQGDTELARECKAKTFKISDELGELLDEMLRATKESNSSQSLTHYA